MDIEFGEYRLRERERELVGPSGPIELSARAFDLLRALLAAPDTVLSKDALFAAAWPGVIVEDNTLQVHMSALRKALGAGFITTVHGRGYKFAGPAPQVAGNAVVAEADTRGNIERYRSEFVKHLDLNMMRKQQFRLVVDYAQGASVDVMADIFNKIGADVIALNATRDPNRYSRTPEEFERDMQVLASITGTLKADLGVRIDTAGERIYVVDERGEQLDGGRLLAAMAELMLRQHNGADVAAPPAVVNRGAATPGGSSGNRCRPHRPHLG